MRTNKIPRSRFLRMINWTLFQKIKTEACSIEPLLISKIVVLTGGNRGVGLETAKGLLNRGAEVIILSRNRGKAEKIIGSLEGRIHFVKLDLSDINSVKPAVEELKAILGSRKIDILINNAGVALSEPLRLSPQGYEFTFAVNVLGHHLLFKECYSNSLLASDAHIIAVTGDIYFMADDCTPDFVYEGKSGVSAYSRSKVGVMWWAKECHRLYPDYKVNTVHPGVIPMGLGADSAELSKRILGKIFLSTKGGAQTTLICATQPNIENGAYYNNVYGKAILPKDDIALNTEKSKEFWETLDRIYGLYF